MSKHIRKTRLTTIALMATLLLGLVTPASASETQSAVSSSLSKVTIAENSYFEIKQIHLLPSRSGNLATFTVTLHNEGSSVLKFTDYWARLKSKSGIPFSARLLPADQDKNIVAPGSTSDFTFYATVNANTKLQDLVVQIIKWDFSQPNFEHLLGEVAIPDTFTDVTAADDVSVISVGGSDLKASITKFTSNKNEKYYIPTVYLTLENVGSQAVTIPSYLFSIRTSDGLVYPLDAKGTKDLNINPKESKEIQLSGPVPVSVAEGNWQLTVAEGIADLKLNIPIAAFQLPTTTVGDEASFGKEYSFTSKLGIYTAQLNALHRLPWDDQDILTADLTLSNKGEESLPIPKLAGYFILDNAVKIEANLVQTAKVIGLGASESVHAQLVGKVPYTNEFSQIKLVLQEIEENAPSVGTDTSSMTTTDVLEFSSKNEVQPIPFIGKDESYMINDTGRKSQFKILGVSTYWDNTNVMYSAMVEVTNLEKRFSAVPKLVANFRSADGTVFPATVAEVKNKVSPTGKGLLNVWASVPKGYSTSNLNLILGEAVTDGKLTEGEKDVVDAYVNPVAYWLPEEKTNVATTLANVALFPYTISMNKIGTSIEDGMFTLKFNYELTKEKLTEINTEGHNLLLVFEDGGGEKRFEKKFDFKDFDSINGDSTADEDDKIRLGKRENFKISISDPGLIYKTQFLKQYTLSIYDEFQGQRKRLASQKAEWFITTE